MRGRDDTEMMNSEIRQTRVLSVFLAVIAIVYVGLCLTPSHYAVGLRLLGTHISPWLGSAKPIRSDEWRTLTPLFQIAVRGHFSTVDQISPYHETLRGFWALPILDWSLIFKPQLWAFWVLPPAYAYSLYFTVLWAAFLAGYAILLRQLGASVLVASLGSTILFFSHFVQVWWTSNAPTFSFAPWPLVVFLLPLRPAWKTPLLFWVSAVWIFGFVYPPFIIPAAFVLFVLLVAYRRDILSLSNIFSGIIAVFCLGISFYIYFGDLITLMGKTVYPGSRFSHGGGFEESRILAHFFPYFTTSNFTPLLAHTNACGVSVVATFLPLTILFFADYPNFIEYWRNNKTSLIVSTVALALMLAWMVFPIPAGFGALLLWDRVPPTRMAWGFGLLLTLFLVVLASGISFSFSPLRFWLFAVSVLAAWLVSKIGFTEVWSHALPNAWIALKRSWFDWLAIVPFGLVFLVRAYSSRARQHSKEILLAAAMVTGAATFGTFNPAQPAQVIFNLPEAPLIQRAKVMAERNPNGWAIFPGSYGAVFNGAGIPAINQTLTTPQVEFFRRIFPAMPESQLNATFNRYAHITPKAGAEPHSPFPDIAVVPIEPFLKPVPTGTARGTERSTEQ
jgi:hypothetical protein